MNKVAIVTGASRGLGRGIALTLAKEAGIFKKNGLDVTLRKVPQKDRHLVLASGDVQCAATKAEIYPLRCTCLNSRYGLP